MTLEDSENPTKLQNNAAWIPLPLSPEAPQLISMADQGNNTFGEPSALPSPLNEEALMKDSYQPSDASTILETEVKESTPILASLTEPPDGLKALSDENSPNNVLLFNGTKLYSGFESHGPPSFIKEATTPPNEIEPIIPKAHIPSEITETPVITRQKLKRDEVLRALRCHCHIAAPLTYDPTTPAATRLRYLIKYSETIIDCPGVYDGLSARIAIDVGFPGLYMTGAGTTASRLGAADLGIAQLHDMRTNAEMIANLVPDGPPLIADMDTGYGGPIVIAKAVREYHVAGVAAFHIEDQIMQKRCGHLAGKEVVDIETYIQRIKACKVAAKKLRSDIVIIARTDALQSRGYAECIERLRRARDVGADMGILEGFSSKEQAAQAVKDLAPWPLTLNSVENGVSPRITTQEAQTMGFRAIIFSFAAIAAAYVEVKRTLQFLRETGTTGSKVTPKQIFETCGLSESIEIDEFAGGTAFKQGV